MLIGCESTRRGPQIDHSTQIVQRRGARPMTINKVEALLASSTTRCRIAGHAELGVIRVSLRITEPTDDLRQDYREDANEGPRSMAFEAPRAYRHKGPDAGTARPAQWRPGQHVCHRAGRDASNDLHKCRATITPPHRHAASAGLHELQLGTCGPCAKSCEAGRWVAHDVPSVRKPTQGCRRHANSPSPVAPSRAVLSRCIRMASGPSTTTE